MCGRYKLSTPGDELWEHFDLHGEQLPLVPRYNIAPTQPIAVIRVPHTLELVRWGFDEGGPTHGRLGGRCFRRGCFLRRSLGESAGRREDTRGEQQEERARFHGRAEVK